MRLFGSERMSNMMDSLGVDEDTPLDHKMLSRRYSSRLRRPLKAATSRPVRAFWNTTML